MKKIFGTILLSFIRDKMPQMRFNLIVRAYERKHKVTPGWRVRTIIRKICGIKQPRFQ